MSKDYKSASKGKTSAKRDGGSSVAAGLLIGLCIGVALTAGAAWYLNKRSNLFGGETFATKTAEAAAPKSKDVPPTEILSPQGASGGVPASKATEPAAAPAAPVAEKGKDKAEGDRFKFYELLSESGEKKPEAQTKPAPDTPPAKVQLPKGTYLQVGAFHDEGEANNLKAKLALIGVEANLETTEISGQGVLHRVRIGPIGNVGEIDKMRALLKGNGIDSALVKN